MTGLLYFLLTLALNINIGTTANEPATIGENPFLGMWSLDIEGGGVGWLEVHERHGFLDGNLLWIGGSVLPVGHIYLADENTLVVTRTFTVTKHKDAGGKERKHTMTFTLRAHKVGDQIAGHMTAPNRDGMGESTTAFVGHLPGELLQWVASL